MKKTLTVKIDENHPIWKEKNKSRVILDALELYYAAKAVVTGTVKLNTLPVNPPTGNEEKNEITRKKQAIKSFLKAFS